MPCAWLWLLGQPGGRRAGPAACAGAGAWEGWSRGGAGHVGVPPCRGWAAALWETGGDSPAVGPASCTAPPNSHVHRCACYTNCALWRDHPYALVLAPKGPGADADALAQQVLAKVQELLLRVVQRIDGAVR